MGIAICHLQDVDGSFTGAGFELKDLIHRFHQGPAREIYLRCDSRFLDPPVAHAIVTGLIDRKSVPAELLDHLASVIKFYEDQEAKS